MSIGSTNISFGDLRTEFVGGNNNSISFSQLYRSGSNILEPSVAGLTYLLVESYLWMTLRIRLELFVRHIQQMPPIRMRQLCLVLIML